MEPFCPIAIDLETTGLDFRREKITVIGGYSNATDNWVIRDPNNFLLGALKKASGRLVVGHNFKFDLKFLSVSNDVRPSPDSFRAFTKGWVADTRLMAFVCTDKVTENYLEWYGKKRQELNKTLPKGVSHRDAGRYSLKTLAPYFLNVEPFWENPSNHDNDTYVLKDCEYTLRLYEVLNKKLEEQGSQEFCKRLLAWEKMLLNMELRGIELNQAALEQAEIEYRAQEEQFRQELDSYWQEARRFFRERQEQELKQKYSAMAEAALAKLKDQAKAPHTIARYKKLFEEASARIEELNYDSPKQMSWLLGEFKNYDLTTFEGEQSTGKEVLNRLAKEGHPDVKAYLGWRKAQKVLTMYLPTYSELQYNGTINPSFNITGTRTGRLSSSSPNLQQVPGDLYKLFKPRDGYKFVVYDLSGIEAALIALYTEDKALYDILASGVSIHNYNAKVFFNLECDVAEVADKFPKERKAAKTAGFALFYGAGWRRIKASMMSAGFQLSDKQAKEMLKRFQDYYATAFEVHAAITQDFEAGDTIKNLLGRPIKIQPWENAHMNGLNTLVQSSASDLNVRACELAVERWGKKGLDAHPLLLIHDCIVAEAKAEQALEAANILTECMTGFKLTTTHGPIQLQVEGGVSNEWQK